jgi:hypothetical protein
MPCSESRTEGNETSHPELFRDLLFSLQIQRRSSPGPEFEAILEARLKTLHELCERYGAKNADVGTTDAIVGEPPQAGQRFSAAGSDNISTDWIPQRSQRGITGQMGFISIPKAPHSS